MIYTLALILLCIVTVALYAHFVMRIPSWRRAWLETFGACLRDRTITGNAFLEIKRMENGKLVSVGRVLAETVRRGNESR